MKIKELHLRNIASIERADIDFTKGLIDGVTGDPASIFLICGDTGAGKSVILDGITMALYKTTPRLQSVENRNKNNFSNSNGESVSINSIQQYTRLGISQKDESYSELVFEGNDGKEYTAKLTLGMSLTNADKTTGKRILKYRKVGWTLNNLDRDGDIKQKISEVVGLSFEQFGRMAMLAQGQFASFLVGDKKERESILEQLTNTEHFTTYGNAINNLHKKAEDKFKTAEAVLKSESQDPKSDEEIAQLHKEKSEKEAAKAVAEKKMKAVQERIDSVRLIEVAAKALAEASSAEALLQETINGEEFKDAVAITRGWNETVEQRRALADMRKAGNEKRDELETEKELRQTFTELSADLLHRKAEAKTKEAELAERKKWMDGRKDRDTLYTEAGAVDVKIGNYIKTVRDIAGNKEKTAAEKSKTTELAAMYEEAKRGAEAAVEAVRAKQEEIDKLTAAWRELDPDKTNKELSETKDWLSRLEHIKTAVQNLEKTKKEAEGLTGRIREDEAALRDHEKVLAEAKTEFEAAEKEKEDSLKLLTTMEMSVNDTIITLRHKVADEHAKECPLCGQSIVDLKLDDDFSRILDPLRETQDKAEVNFVKAQMKFEETKEKYNKAKGSHETKVAELEKTRRNIEESVRVLNSDAAKAGLNVEEGLNPQIEKAMEFGKEKILDLQKRQRQAIDIQKDIERLNKERKPLDEAKNAADKNENVAKKAVDDNATAIKRLEEDAVTLKESMDKLAFEIGEMMAVAYPDWKSDVETTRAALREDAAEYNDRKRKLAEAEVDMNMRERDIRNIEGQCEAVIRRHSDWRVAPEPLPYPYQDVQSGWRNLLVDVQNSATKIEGFDARIRECSEFLADYYAQSGKSEEDLDAIAARADEIGGMQKFIDEINGNLKSRRDAIAAERKKIDDAKVRLGVEKDEDIPALGTLEEEKAKLTEENEEIVSSLSSIRAQLEEDAKNRAKVEKLKAEVDAARVVFDKWNKLNNLFGGTKLRTLVQSYILRPLLNNANIYLERITDRYVLTCSEDNEQLSIFVLDRYNKNQVRSVTVLSGGERFMISLALSLALSSLNRPDMNINILFIDEGFGTLDEKSLDSVMQTLERLQEIAGESKRRVGIISHREELNERIPVQIQVLKKGEGRSTVQIKN